MFEWNWLSIAKECTEFLGPAGYGIVQTSPPQEHVTGTQWWTAYQPVSYTIQSNRGSREQFTQMIATCNAAGVKVIADGVINHMAGADSGVGTANSNFTHYVYPGIYQNQDFHHCGLTPNDNIEDYNNRDQVQKCQLVGLADLATDTPYVQGRIAEYLKDLLSLGVYGFRLDASKHMASQDIQNILSQAGPVSYISQEVIYGNNEPIKPDEYVQNGNVQEFRYTETLKWAFLEGGISNLKDFGSWGWLSSDVANVFVANHDTERDSSLNYKSPSNTYILAQVFSLAHPYGANPTILSSYLFNNRDDGAPNNWQGTCSGNTGANGWLCQHRWPPVAGMVGFRNTVGNVEMNNWQTGTQQQIAFGRGTLGFVVLNNEDGVWQNKFTTSLPDGTYCDVYDGPKGPSGCAGSSYTVVNGSFEATVKGRNGLALHVNALATDSVNGLLSKAQKRHSHGLRSLKGLSRRRLFSH
ncbi:hypothetical protein FRC19_011686 [Serendipita sp. 401]|nr:hypothetical protein FRC19_011686 [Serendipita sp. 401]